MAWTSASASNKHLKAHLINSLFDLFPICPPLDKFVDTTHQRHLWENDDDSLFGRKRSTISGNISDNLRQVLGITDDINMTQHLQIGEIVRYPLLFQGSHESMISVKICNDLESTL
jgi:hypothetical protein